MELGLKNDWKWDKWRLELSWLLLAAHHRIFNSILNRLQSFNNLIIQGRCRFKSLTSTSKCLLPHSMLPARLDILYHWKQNHSPINMDPSGLHYCCTEPLNCSPPTLRWHNRQAWRVHIFLCLHVYSFGSRRGVDWKHNPSQNPEGSTLINVQSLGGSPPSGLCPAGCCRWLERPGGLPGWSWLGRQLIRSGNGKVPVAPPHWLKGYWHGHNSNIC